MVGFTRFCWSDGQLSKRFSLVYKWGDDIYGMLVAKLAEYGYIPDENTQLCIVCYDGVASTIEDSDSLWEAIEGFGGYGDDEGGVSNGANSHQRSLDGNIIRSGSRDDVEMRIWNLEEKLERMVIMLGERIECDQK
ncbi:hypothetical protein Tcan_16886 [Toxocara canis]|uniref:Uncharacterized protein n=1 Tax=Toxocara canis TaxID=6265 RepID=A0A0B2V059_TOXCA|nr:hypothetical protein Tcan_16886 [Toxocara canis]